MCCCLWNALVRRMPAGGQEEVKCMPLRHIVRLQIGGVNQLDAAGVARFHHTSQVRRGAGQATLKLAGPARMA